MTSSDGLLLGHVALPSLSRHRRLTDPFRLNPTDLLTHAFVCGATGSGKTVLGKAIVEEGALLGIPTLVVDLKGDLSSLALAGAPLLTGADAELAVLLGDEHAENRRRFRDAAEAGPDFEGRCRAFAERVAVEVYTPRSEVGRPIALASFPRIDVKRDQCATQEREDYEQLLQAFVDSFLARLTGTDKATEKRRNERSFLITLLMHAWETGQSYEGLDGLERLVQAVFLPPFQRVGALPVDLQLDENGRIKLARAINNHLVGLERSWHVGEPFDLARMLRREDGRTPIIVLNVSHLDAFHDRAFVIAQACYAIHRWMRRQGSASKPRLLFFLDEIGAAGARESFYPSHPFNPPSKGPINLVLRQGRAFGVCCVLATQNVIGVDHQGLGNCSTWMVGPLNSGRERARIRESLGALGAASASLDREIASLQPGEFVARTRDGDLQRFQERWLYSVHRVLAPHQLGLIPKAGAIPTARDDRYSGMDQPSPRPEPWHRRPEAPANTDPRPRGEETVTVTRGAREETVTVAARASWRIRTERGAALVLRPGQTYCVGRQPGCDLVLDDPTVSRRHLELDVLADGISVRADARVKNRPLIGIRDLGPNETVLITESPTQVVLGDVSLTIVRD